MINRKLLIGIDPGSKTGMAIVENSAITEIRTCGIIEAMRRVIELRQLWQDSSMEMTVVVEDARLRRWFGAVDKKQARYGSGVREGAGAAKRESAIWEEFLVEMKINHRMVPPLKGGTKLSATQFEAMTGHKQRTSSHARDAGVLTWHYAKRI